MSRKWIGWGTAVSFMIVLLTACSVSETAVVAETVEMEEDPVLLPTPTEVIMPELPDLGAAPEIINQTWLNADEPVTLASQRGKVVLLEFWTFGCINCQRTIPWVQEWQSAYGGEDFQVISVHYPEFAYERDVENVANALKEYGITYPVAIDNERETWGAYNQRFWPTTYLIDKNGRIRYQHIGEFMRGSDKEAVAAIEALLAE